jgi:hypothetical protein
MTQLAQPKGALQIAIARSQVTLPADPNAPAELSEDAELQLVIQETIRFEDWLNKTWMPQYREADILYQALRGISAYEGTQVTKANISRFTVAKLVNAIVPKIMKAIFSQDPPFKLRAYPAVSEDTIRAKTAVFAACLNRDVDGVSVEGEVEEGILNKTAFGTEFYDWGWEETVRTQRRYKRKEKPIEAATPVGTVRVDTKVSEEWELEKEEVREGWPFLRSCDPRDALIDPEWDKPDARQAHARVIRKYLTFDELDQLRNEPGYEIPSREDLLDLFFPPKETALAPGNQTSANTSGGGISAPAHAEEPWNQMGTDPLSARLEVLQYETRERTVVVLQRKLKIKSGDSEFGCLTLFSSNWWNVPKNGRGIGAGRIVGQDQRVDTGVINAALDVVSNAMNADYVVARGANVLTQQTRQSLGKWLVVDGDPKSAFVLKEQPKVPPETWMVLQGSKAESESAMGANEQLVMGATPSQGKTSLGRTATGAAAMMGATDARLEGPLTRTIRQVFIPFLYKMDEMINDRMPSAQIKAILGRKLGPAYQFDEEEFRNAQLEFDVLAGAKLAQKQAMAQILPLLIELFTQPQLVQILADVNGEYADLAALVREMMEMAGYVYNDPFIKPMTPQMAQRYQQSKQQGLLAAKTAAQSQLSAQGHEQKSAEIDQKSQNQLAAKAMEGPLEQGFERAVRAQEMGALEGGAEPLSGAEG